MLGEGEGLNDVAVVFMCFSDVVLRYKVVK